MSTHTRKHVLARTVATALAVAALTVPGVSATAAPVLAPDAPAGATTVAAPDATVTPNGTVRFYATKERCLMAGFAGVLRNDWDDYTCVRHPGMGTWMLITDR